MSKLLLTFYGDDFTGSTDALEQLAAGGVRTMLFIEPPTPARLARFKNLEAVGVAGMTRSMTPATMERELSPALAKLKALGARHVHYKVCSTFDSSPRVGNIGKVIDLATQIFHPRFIPVLAAAPAFGRFTVFGNHFARFSIGSKGEVHRLDRHPSISKHPITPMTESDLRAHLARQTRKRIALFDIVKVSQPTYLAQMSFKWLLAEKPDVVLFDALVPSDLVVIGRLLEAHATARRPLFSVGSSAVEMALGANWPHRIPRAKRVPPVKQILVGSGSCSPVTAGQIAWALKHGFKEVPLNAGLLASAGSRQREIQRASAATLAPLRAGRSVIVHTTRSGSDKRVATKLRNKTAQVLGTALGQVLRGVLDHSKGTRICIAGGDTSSYAARALGIEAIEWVAAGVAGAPVCRAHAPGSPMDGCEVVFKGGQVGVEDCFQAILKGHS